MTTLPVCEYPDCERVWRPDRPGDLTRYQDSEGVERAYCQEPTHRAFVRAKYPTLARRKAWADYYEAERAEGRL